VGIRREIIYLMTFGMELAACCQGKGQPQTLESGLPITVWVENWAEVSPMVLTRAQNVAAKIFGQAGVDVKWQTVSAPASSPLPGAGATFVLRVMPSRDAVSPEPALGFRWQRGIDDVRAVVFFDRVEQFAEQSSGSTAAILGCAMAHELGHILLGSSHSRQGVMRAQWNKQDAWAASHGNLHFTQEQEKLIRAELDRRLSSRR